MKSVLFVTQSPTRGGVVTMLGHTLSGWPESDDRKLVLAHNRGHGGKTYFESLAGERIVVEEIPIWDHMWALSRLEKTSVWKAFYIKLLNRIVQPLLFLQAVLYFRKLCIEQEVDAAFSHNGGYPGGMLNRAAVLGARIAGVRRNCLVVHSLARRPGAVTLPLSRLHDALVFGAVSDLVAVSEACANALIKERFVRKKIAVIYNGIPTASLAPSEKCSNSPMLAYVGELSEGKGLPILFNAVALIREPVHLVLYGKGEAEYEEYLHGLARTLGIENRLAFKGFDPDAPAKLADADMLVLPSIAYESFGMVLLEAMRQKKPAIVTDVGGMKEVVVDGETGFVVPAGDASALADAILRLLENAELAARFGENGYRRLCEEFSAEKMISHYFPLTL
ncbi:MAG: glycosyltransferase [Burkholderiales bacterium]